MYEDENKSVMMVKDWLITWLIMCIPFVNIVMVFLWAFGNGNENRKNLFRAILILYGIIIVFGIIVGIIFGVMGV